MGMVAPNQRIASAYFVICGQHGDVSRFAEQQGVCRQSIYRQAGRVKDRLEDKDKEEIRRLRQQVKELTECVAERDERLAVAVVFDKEKQEQFATVCQSHGTSLPTCWHFLDFFIAGKQESVATLGRATLANGKKSGPLLAVLDELGQKQVRDTAPDEIYVKAAVLMLVEQESLCWLTGRVTEKLDGEAWAQEFRQFPNLDQVCRDGGKALAKGVAIINAERQAQGLPPVVDKGDHFHALRKGGVALGKEEQKTRQALAKAEVAQKELEECRLQGTSERIVTIHANAAWQKAEKAMDTWCAYERLWQKTKEALRLFTPEGDLNTRQQAEAVLVETLAQLPDTFAHSKRQVQKPEMLNYLDHVQQQLEALPFAEEVKHAAVRQEALRRRPDLLNKEGTQAAALRGVLLACAVVLAKAEEVGQQAQTAVRDILRRAYRASSLVECINSVLRMHQSRHRKMTQGLIDLKRLYWNCHTFRTGRRRGTTPYQRLGIPWPKGLRWWDVLKLTPEQLREKLSTAESAK